MGGITVTLGGVPLTLASGHVWTLGYGVEPYQRTFIMSRDRAKKVLQQTNPLTLVMASEGHKTVRIEGLYALQPSEVDENNVGVVVMDARWKLTRKSVTRDYNVRRRTGDFRRVGNTLQPIQAQALLPDISYRRGSLKDGVKWTAREILADLLTELVGPAGYSLGNTEFSVDIEGLVLDRDRGDGALARVLAYIPGARMFVDRRGVLRVVDSLDGGELAMAQKAGPRYRRMPGQIEFIDRHRLRPDIVRVEYEVEAEVRFDYDEDNWNPTLVPGNEARILQNVIPVADATLTYVTAAGKQVTLTEGTWLPVQEWVAAVHYAASNASAGTAGRYPGGDSSWAIGMDELRRHFLTGFQHIRNQLSFRSAEYVDLVWEKRIAALAAHFRQTFRIHPAWMDKLRSIRAVRAAILDQETGSRGRAEVYTYYFIKPSRRTMVKERMTRGIAPLGYNIGGYAANLNDAKSAPATVSIVDDEVGVFTVTWRGDPWGDAAKILPGTISDPTVVYGVANADPKILDSQNVVLDTGWKMAVVLTVIPAMPNNSRRLYTVDVDIPTAFKQLGTLPPPRVASGPAWTVGISAGVETARFMWSDDEADNIQNVLCAPLRAAPEDPNNVPMLAASWAQLREKLLTNQATTDAVAAATAARIHALLLDRFEGSEVVRIDPAIEPAGSMASVSHAISGRGHAVTIMLLPPILQAPDLYALLPDGARKILQRQVQQ